MGYIDYVNVRQGTKSSLRYSSGNTLPLVQCPFGMLSLAPQTDGKLSEDNRNSRWYNPDSPYIEGIRVTHQPSPWIGDYGTFLMVPQADSVLDDYTKAWSGCKIDKTVIMPNYVKAEFMRSDAVFEATVSERCIKVRNSFEHGISNKCISFFGLIGNIDFEFDQENNCIYGVTDGFESCVANNFKMFFVVVPKSNWIDYEQSKIISGKNNDGVMHLYVHEDIDEIEFDIAISYIDKVQAMLNSVEIADKSFEKVKSECEKLWEEFLSRIQIETSDCEKLKTFYSCMYRCGLFPHKAYEIDVNGNPVHYSPYTGKVHSGKRYGDNGFWDTYRTIFPLFSIIEKDVYKDMVESALSDFKESGWLPRWVSMGENGCMPSTLIDSVIAQAAQCGILNDDMLKDAYLAMRHHAENTSPDSRFGRDGIAEYKKMGYVPYGYKGSVNLTLDFAYGDYCIAILAKILGDKTGEELYLSRAENYKNIFDNKSGFMRARLENGKFKEPFDPYEWGGEYTEACAWQTTFAVQHRLDGLAELMGGETILINKLEELFEQKPKYRVGAYEKEIHEMTEMAAVDFGLCAISNQPSFHLPYIFAYFGKKDKTQKYITKMCDELFTYKTDGFPGDEDNGSMAAWYVLSCLGIYPICPADDVWVKIKPQYKARVCGIDIESLELKERLL